MKGKKVCVVTPDTIGPVKNGGIGTFVYNLALLLAQEHDVTVFFTGEILEGTFNKWYKRYKDLGINFYYTGGRLHKYSGFYYDNPAADRSYRIFKALEKCDFDFIHFQDWQANGFHTIQAKKTLGLFRNTMLTVTMHSSTEWINEGARRWNVNPVGDMKLEWMERYCHENCDVLITPSEYMYRWAVGRRWPLKDRTPAVKPCCFVNAGEYPAGGGYDKSHLIFFGRLETRKGLELFCESLAGLASDEGFTEIKKVSFVGGHSSFCSGGNSRGYLKSFIRKYDKRFEITVKDRLDTFSALQYIKRTRGVAVIASLCDNLPYTVIECIENHIPFIASDSGGIPELVAGEALFHPSHACLTEKIKEIGKIDFSAVKHKYRGAEANNAGWMNLHGTPYVPAGGARIDETPLVSICIAYYNYGMYLDELVDSIKGNDYPNYEVILVNDGSTDSFSRTKFDAVREALANEGKWHFYDKTNTGVGDTRNFAVSRSSGEFIIFMDADNRARPYMVSDFVRGMLVSGADCLSCHCKLFEDGRSGGVDIYAPYGACLEAGLYQNVFGDANFIIRREVFDKLGGFGAGRDTSWEDYELLARLCLKGYKLDVVPKVLFEYRMTAGGFSRITNQYLNHRRVLDSYLKDLPDYIAFFIQNCALPTFYRRATNFQRIKRFLNGKPLLKKIAVKIYRLFYG